MHAPTPNKQTQIRYRDDPAAVLSAAARLGAGRARPALELVGFDGGVEAAMKYVFGGAFVCADAATAKKLAFAREVERRCVTLEGDDFNPKGLLTGGARQQARGGLGGTGFVGVRVWGTRVGWGVPEGVGRTARPPPP
jgi:chromosome segregation ATPase